MRRATALILTLSATAGAAQVREGVYESPSCSTAEVSEMRITVSDGEIQFYETLCALGPGTPVPGLDGALLHEATCSGEGETWTHAMLLMPAFDGGLIRVESGLAVTYALCGKSG